jgi:hypothetical protein
MLTYADVCWRMLTYADVCCMQADAGVGTEGPRLLLYYGFTSVSLLYYGFTTALLRLYLQADAGVGIEGPRLLLVPYCSEHVKPYHLWMLDPLLRRLTGLSLSLPPPLFLSLSLSHTQTNTHIHTHSHDRNFRAWRRR